MEAKIKAIFKEKFGEKGTLYASAGRINLIGEHTDYNGGYVFPGAIDKEIMAEIKPNGTDKVRVFSIDINEYAEFGLKEEDAPQQQWARYIFGICREIIKRGGTVKGFDAVFAGNVPLGAGLSSSAALESCFAFALNDLFNGNTIDKFELARIGQSTEHNYCGVTSSHQCSAKKTTSCALTAARWNLNISPSRLMATNWCFSIRRLNTLWLIRPTTNAASRVSA